MINGSFKKNILFSFTIITIFYFHYVSADPNKYFKIRVIDEETGRGIPLVELRTQSWIRYYTDSNGLAAFNEPGLMDQDLYLFIASEGYEYPADFLGNRGFVINAARQDSLVVKMRRTNIAERLYRITGAGIYRDSHLLGEPTPLKNPLLNGKVLGQDSNLRTIYNNQIFWIWGDTFKPAYAWGNFSISAATSLLPGRGGLSPETGINLNYFVDSTGFSKSMILLEEKGFVWFDWVMSLANAGGEEQLVAKYARVKSDFTNHERGIAVYNNQTEMFEKYRQVDAWIDDYHSTEHPFFARVDSKLFAFLTAEFNFLRVEPDLDKLSNPAEYESYTCLKSGTSYDPGKPALDRNREGKIIWGWKANTDAINLTRQNELVKSGMIKENERLLCFQDLATGDPLDLQRGSIYWNNYRRRWILIIQKNVGEVWYAEGDTPIGPWVYAKEVLTHDQFFYNPVHHPFFDEDDGKIIYFEGTYTNSFSANPVIKPRYEYNQLMYRMNLNDARLFLPLPVYELETDEKTKFYSQLETIHSSNKKSDDLALAFFAYSPDRKFDNLIPVYQDFDGSGALLSTDQKGKVLFYALPAETKPFEKYIGTWQCNMTDGIFLIRDFNLTMALKNDQLSASVSDAGYSVSEVKTNGNKFKLSVNYVDKIYKFLGIIEDGKITGTWSMADSSVTGTWKGSIADHEWQAVHSPRLAALYMYTDSQTSNRLYSTKSNLPEPKMLRSDKPICRVWETPSQNLGIDFSIIPEIWIDSGVER